MITSAYIGLTVIALLSLWESELMESLRRRLSGWVTARRSPLLLYFFHCDYCKGFWMCFIGAILAGNFWCLFPAYGILVVWLTLLEQVQND